MPRVAPKKADFRPALASRHLAGYSPEKVMPLTYREQLKHPNWQRRRLERLNASDWECQDCGSKETTLHVHHKRYVRGRMAWEYSDEELMVLCEECHEVAHSVERQMAELFVGADRREALALFAGFNAQNDAVDQDVLSAAMDVDPLSFHIGVCANLLTFLGIYKIADVARYTASLTNEKSDARRICEKWFDSLR